MRDPPMPPPAMPPEISQEALERARARLSLAVQKSQVCADHLPDFLTFNDDPRWQKAFSGLIEMISQILAEIEEVHAILSDEPTSTKERLQ